MTKSVSGGVPAKAAQNYAMVGFGFSLAILLAIGVGTYHVTRQLITANAWVVHTLEVDQTITEVFAATQDIQTGARGYVITGDDSFLEPRDAAVARTNEELKRLGELVADNPTQRERFLKLQTLVAKRMAWTEEVITTRRTQGRDAAAAKVATLEGNRLMEEMRSEVTAMQREEGALLERRATDVNKRTTRTFLSLVAGTLASFAILVAAFSLLRRENAQRREAEATLRQSEERFRLMVSAVKDYAILMLDTDGRVASWNEGAERIKGYRSEEIIGQHFSRFYPEDDITSGKPERELKLATEQGRFEDEGWRVRKDGSRFWANVVMSAVRDETGRLRGFVKVTRDVTERKRIDEELHDLNTQLLTTNKELEAFSYSVSHDLRAPLRGIDGFSRVLEEDYVSKLDEVGRSHLRRIRAATQRMGLLIDNILELSRVSRAEMGHEEVDLSALAESVATELRKVDPKRQVEFRISPGVVVHGDPVLLRVALENLIGNAWKFTSRRLEATIEFGQTMVPGGDVAYFVRDNGAGFDMAYAPKLFGAFQRLHTGAEFEGTGIGLATVQRIIRRHGGRVWADGAVDKGATFHFTLP